MQRRFALVPVLFTVAALTSVALAQEPAKPAPVTTTPAVPATSGQAGDGDHAKPAKKSVYDESADAKQQIAAALAKAKRANQRVLIQWGGNWCPWCILLHHKMTSDADLSRELLYEYQVVHADSGHPLDKNVDLAASYGADLKSFGYPFLTILDADGKPLANQETSALEVKGADGQSLHGKEAGHDAKLVLAFLKKNEAPRQKADAVLKGATEQATASGRKLFVQVGTPTCVWCHRLEDWLASAAIAPLFDKDYVHVLLDLERTDGAKAFAAQLAMPAEAGVPWFAIVDPATGKPLVDSTDGEKSIGYPAEESEIAHFMAMLDATKKNLAAADLQKLKESLVEAAKQLKAPPR